MGHGAVMLTLLVLAAAVVVIVFLINKVLDPWPEP